MYDFFFFTSIIHDYFMTQLHWSRVGDVGAGSNAVHSRVRREPFL